jgi:hypothetical protein
MVRTNAEYCGQPLRPPVRAAAIMSALAVGSCLAAEPKHAAGRDKGTVSISGHAFHFGPRGGRIKGGEVTILECPALKTVTGKRGAYRFDGLRPGSEVSLVFRRRGYRTVQTRTFTLTAEDLERVSFQVPPEILVGGFSMLLGFRPGPNLCQLASTVTRVGESMYGSHGPTHGEPGATVTIDPPLPEKHGPIYFNLKLFDDGSQIIWPDRSLKQTTLDGGVLFIDVPPGEYVLRAHKPGVRFRPVKVKCRAGILVNASPPQGLQALNRPGNATSRDDGKPATGARRDAGSK